MDTDQDDTQEATNDTTDDLDLEELDDRLELLTSYIEELNGSKDYPLQFKIVRWPHSGI